MRACRAGLPSRVRSSKIRGRQQQLLRRASPVERRLEHRQRDGLAESDRASCKSAAWRIDDHVPRRFIARDGAAQAAKPGARPTGAKPTSRNFARASNRQGSLAERRASVETHIQPLAGRREIAQPLANVLLRHESHQRAAAPRRADNSPRRAKLQHARLVVTPARIELAIGVLASLRRPRASAARQASSDRPCASAQARRSPDPGLR